MIFRNTKFSEVIHTIEQSYNVRINITCKNCPTDTFTGTLPLTNLNEVLEVIEKSYHLKAQIKGKEIILTDIWIKSNQYQTDFLSKLRESGFVLYAL